MPGIFGVIGESGDAARDVAAMSAAMRTYPYFVQDEQYVEGSLGASRVWLGNIGMRSTPYRHQDLRLWIEGEVYNLADATRSLNLTGGTFEEALAEAYTTGRLDPFLAKIDGYYCAALYDAKARKVSLISDRFGTRMLYWYLGRDGFAWSSEVKGILALPKVDKTLDETAPGCFLDLGYLMGDQTWFKLIKLIKPATVLEFDANARTIRSRYYWKYSEIKPSGLSFEQAVEGLGEVFLKAVDRRFEPDERLAISLSGGLDSRAILAAVETLHPGFVGYCVTFGIAGCADIQIARKSVRHTRWQHDVFHVDYDQWLEPRLPRVWDTDGMFNIQQLHSGGVESGISSRVKIFLNGYLGGEILGDSYQQRRKFQAANQRINSENAAAVYGRHARKEDLEDPYYDIPHIEAFDLNNRTRRCINMGTVSGLILRDIRVPICDNALIEFIMSLPDEYRHRNRLYSAMLLQRFPKFFKAIPWQRTGAPIGPQSLSARVLRKLKSIPTRIGIRPSTHRMHNYPEWIRRPEILARVKGILCGPAAQAPALFGEDLAAKYLKEHLELGQNRANELLRLLTIEVYLQRALASS